MAKEAKTFGIKDLARSLGIQEATARKNLRDAGIKRSGSAYEWSKGELDATVKKLSAAAPAKAVPARGTKVTKTAKAGAKKKAA